MQMFYNLDYRQHNWRLGFHLQTPTGWLSDPNGLCQFNGEYHIFHQYAPRWPWAGHGWGHWSSPDLTTWYWHGGAIMPSVQTDKNGSYSGSAYGTFQISPASEQVDDFQLDSTVITSLKPGIGSFTAEWRETLSLWYELRHSTSSDFRDAKVVSTEYTFPSMEITGLGQGRTYYVQVRAVLEHSNGRYYSTWSPAKSVTTKTSEKLANPMTVKGKTVRLKPAALKKKAQSVKLSKALVVQDAEGKVSYKLAVVDKSTKKFTLTASKLTVKKGTPKGTYKLTVKVTAAGNSTYKAATKTTKITVTIK